MKTELLTEEARTPGQVSAAEMQREESLIQNIVVPLDFSTPALKALDYALALASTKRATVEVVYVFQPSSPIVGPEMLPVMVDETGAVEECRKRLDVVVKSYENEGTPLKSQVLLGRPAEEIVALARSSEADLIVISTHGRTGVGRSLLGSVAERVVRHAPCPVLVVRKHERDFAVGSGKARLPLDVREILVPTDFSESSLRAVEYGRKFATQFGGKITLIHSIPFPPIFHGKGTHDPRSISAERRETARSRLNELANNLLPAELRREPVVCVGSPLAQIPDYASIENFDLVICGSGGHSRLHHAMLGSTAEGIVRLSACPVLVVGSECRSAKTAGREA